MKVFAIVTTSLLLVGGGAGGYMYLNCPSRCGGGSDAVIQQEVPPCCPSEAVTAPAPPATTPVAATPVAAPAAATPIKQDCPPTPDCSGPGCDEKPAAKKDECCDLPPDGCCPSETAPAKIEK